MASHYPLFAKLCDFTGLAVLLLAGVTLAVALNGEPSPASDALLQNALSALSAAALIFLFGRVYELCGQLLPALWARGLAAGRPEGVRAGAEAPLGPGRPAAAAANAPSLEDAAELPSRLAA